MDRKSLEDILSRVDEFAKMTRQAVSDSMPGAPLGATAATPIERALLLERKQADWLAKGDPNYIACLPFVDGGMAEVRNYEQVRGLRGR